MKKFFKQCWECLRGRHKWVELRSPKRSLFVCDFCVHRSWEDPREKY